LPSGAGRVGCGHRTPPPSRGSTPRPDEEHPVGERRGDLALQLEPSLSSGDSRLASSRGMDEFGCPRPASGDGQPRVN
jgi:hypothetical protein